MSFEIKALHPSNQDDFFQLFENDNFDHQSEWGSCYCRFYHTNCTMDEWKRRNAMFNRADAVSAILEGSMHGFLAYENDECVGWVNASSILNYPRIFEDIPKLYRDSQIALVICFVIEERHRQQHVASRLLDHAIHYFFEQGYHAIMALPRESSVPEHNYRGFTQMYLDRGFKEVEKGIYLIKKPL